MNEGKAEQIDKKKERNRWPSRITKITQPGPELQEFQKSAAGIGE
jgi:hypothetical protein